jgi:hypothetical protein
VIFLLIGPRGVRIVDIEGILEEVVVKVIGYASRKNAFWLISIDSDCSYLSRENTVTCTPAKTLERHLLPLFPYIPAH